MDFAHSQIYTAVNHLTWNDPKCWMFIFRLSLVNSIWRRSECRSKELPFKRKISLFPWQWIV